MWRLQSILLNIQQITAEIKKKYIETNRNKNLFDQNLFDAAKAVIKETFLVVQTYLRKQETSQINN